MGTLLTLGTAIQDFATSKNVAFESLAYLPNKVWSPAACPLCKAGLPLEDVAGFQDSLRGANREAQ